MKKILLTLLMLMVVRVSHSDELITDVYIESTGFNGFTFVEESFNRKEFMITPDEFKQVVITNTDVIELNYINQLATECDIHSMHTFSGQNPEEENDVCHKIIYGFGGTYIYTSVSITKAIIAATNTCLEYNFLALEGDDVVPYFKAENDFILFKDIDKMPFFAPKLEFDHENPDYVIGTNVTFWCAIPRVRLVMDDPSDD